MNSYERVEEYKSIPVTGDITVRRLIFSIIVTDPERLSYIISLVTLLLSTTTVTVAGKVLLSALSPTVLCVVFFFFHNSSSSTLVKGRQVLEVQLEANEIYHAW